MKLERLVITHLPGLRQGFTLEQLDPGVNLVTGPNACGKSSLVRALGYLLDTGQGVTEAPGAGAVTLEAEFSAGADRLRVTRTGGQRVWQRNGQPDLAPPLPAADFLHCYWIAMHDLMAAEGTDRAILDQLVREMAGGFDLNAVRDDPRFSIGPRHGSAQEKQLLEKDRALRATQQQYQSLERERGRLPVLEADIATARKARVQAERITQGLGLLEARQQREILENRLGTFAPGLGNLQGDERERLEQLEAQQDRCQQALENAQLSMDQAQAQIDATGLTAQPPTAAEMAARGDDLDQARQLAVSAEEKSQALDQALAEQQQAAAGLNRAPGALPSVTPEQVDQASRLAETRIEKQRQLQALTQEDHTSTAPDAADMDAQRTLAEELRRWLRQLAPGRSQQLLLGSALALGFALLAAVVALFSAALFALVPALSASGAAGWALWQLRGMQRVRREVQQRVAELPLAPPESWTAAAVTELLRATEKTLAQQTLQKEQATLAQSLNQQRAAQRHALEQALADVEQQHQQLATAIGFDPAATAQGVLRFAQLTEHLFRASSQRSAIESTLERLRQQLSQCQERVQTLCQQQGLALPPEADLASLRHQFQGLQQQLTRLQEAQSERLRASEERQRLQQSLAETQQALTGIYQRAGLSANQRAELLALCEQLPGYREAQDQLREARAVERERRIGMENGVEPVPELEALIEAGDRGALEQQREQYSDQARQLDDLQSERASLLARLNQAGQDQALAQARVARQQAQDHLQQAWDQAMLAEAGQFLLSQVAQEHRTEHQPQVLARARERFAGFTDQRYDLQLDDQGELLVWDTVQGLAQTPTQLSTGTHMQLFLAMRLAWTSVHEVAGEALPLFLDEVLTTSDPERFRNIVHNLQSLAEQEGRQVFYLSAEPGDRHRWQQLMPGKVHHVDLHQARAGEAWLTAEDFALPAPATLPAPSAMTAQEYAQRIGVPRLEPHQGAGAIHLFYLLRDDLPTLHRLLEQWRTRQLGQLELLLESPAAGQALGEPVVQAQLRGRCQAARVWLALWLEGRGLPVERNALEQSKAVSDTFIDAVDELAKELKGDGRRLIESLKDGGVARFQRTKAQDLEDWLIEEGYISRSDPLSAAERARQTLLKVGGQVRAEDIQPLLSWLESGIGAEKG